MLSTEQQHINILKKHFATLLCTPYPKFVNKTRIISFQIYFFTSPPEYKKAPPMNHTLQTSHRLGVVIL